MKLAISVVLISCATLCVSDHLILGNMEKKEIIHHSVEQYHAIPFTKRDKAFFFSSPDQQTINSIIAYDNLHSKATALVTAGGIGFTYVNIKMESERGKGLDFDIGIYS